MTFFVFNTYSTIRISCLLSTIRIYCFNRTIRIFSLLLMIIINTLTCISLARTSFLTELKQLINLEQTRHKQHTEHGKQSQHVIIKTAKWLQKTSCKMFLLQNTSVSQTLKHRCPGASMRAKLAIHIQYFPIAN